MLKEYIKILIKEEIHLQKTEKQLKDFIYNIVPGLIAKHMIQQNSVKVCSSIAPDFNRLALKNGFDSYVVESGSHVYNIITLTDGIYKIDLSYIQFEFCEKNVDSYNDAAGKDPFSYYGEHMETNRLLDIVRKNPFAAIKIEKIN